MNPYQKYLDRSPAASLVAEFPAKLITVVSRLGDSGLKRSLAPGKWSAGEILCHLADTEIAFSFRWRQTLAEENHTIQTFDQDRWATPYARLRAEEAVQAFVALRRWNTALLAGLSPADWEREAFHPELGPLRFETLVEVMAGHDLNHLAQLEAIAAGGGT